MSQRSGQIFPLILIGFLAALSFWLERVVDLPDARRDGKLRHDPDAIVENFTLRQFDEEGLMRSRLKAPHMLHYPDDDSSLVQRPLFTYYRPELPETNITAKQARITEKGDKVVLWDNVVAHRAATSNRSAMTARMHDLTIFSERGTGYTDGPAEITQESSWMKGIGMDLDNNTSTFILRSQVTGILKRTKPQP
ncbi:MAG: Lipopolysaccharide-assembly, LptC-related [Betaproteobacteria bacterium ADurb.Bin341]|nr:MAG: Lipopolysaccharide-assembly, LptC-related [Betaproteobacteria bacterium ADurb.Bin341]